MRLIWILKRFRDCWYKYVIWRKYQIGKISIVGVVSLFGQETVLALAMIFISGSTALLKQIVKSVMVLYSEIM